MHTETFESLTVLFSIALSVSSWLQWIKIVRNMEEIHTLRCSHIKLQEVVIQMRDRELANRNP